ncbi:GNAT family N-acetyltransferase [Actinocrinis puniceicyclus]|uniref:GNAT family N-acetyltransferase n=1 Tax=Actinocrinis puniceicyclus TaxID=977794 RepID=A0A8J7WQS7_9ACTN|nr:GNAT family N-acetyltransferase [Actinocrinis puniceicyclus]MBS2963810.1 GNAT family N-acetyltransferase [Actinocrinis puniceicyclus]
MTIEISRFDPIRESDVAVRDWFDLAAAIAVEQRPEFPAPEFDSYVEQLRLPVTAFGPQSFWAARDSGELVGAMRAIYLGQENSNSAFVTVNVRSDRRREGIGTQLLAGSLTDLREQRRSLVVGQNIVLDGPADRWATKLGFAKVQQRAEQHLRVKEVDPELWQTPAPSGFRMRRWIDSAPEELLEGFATLRNSIADAPKGDSSYQPPEWTPARVRQEEAEVRAAGRVHRFVAAVHEHTGTLAGFTELAYTLGYPSVCFQQDTAVLRDFRGLGLGRAIKAEMMRWLIAEQASVETVMTNTGADNVHMIRVNHQLGYVTVRITAFVEAETELLSARTQLRG